MEAFGMKKPKAYLVIGCPGSGKSWVCDQLKDKFNYIPHDDFKDADDGAYAGAIIKAAKEVDQPLLIETPFSISQLKEPLEKAGVDVVPVFIQEYPITIETRYKAREGKHIPRGHITRQATYLKRAKEWSAFQGTSEQVLEHLRKVAE